MQPIKNKKTKTKPIAVVISDVHYKLDTLELADRAFRMAIDVAAELEVPLIDCGDLTNDKAILRAEIVNKLLETAKYACIKGVYIYSIVGNHSLLNEKSTEANALNFLQEAGTRWEIIKSPTSVGGFNFIPYQPNPEDFYEALDKFPKDSLVFGHQGTMGGYLGDYIQDHSKIDPVRIKDWRVFLGHYHQHYDLENTVSVGNPYTLTYGEANDPEKGFLVVYSDGSYRRQLISLRRHVVWEGSLDELPHLPTLRSEDLLWIKLRGLSSELASISKESIAKIIGFTNFKLDKISLGTESVLNLAPTNKTSEEIMDSLVDNLNETPEQREALKKLWRETLRCV